MPISKNILCVDSNDDHNELLKFFFEQAGFNVITCNTPGECLHYTKEKRFSAIILDSWLEDSVGLDILQILKYLYPETPLIFFTGDARTKSREKAMKVGASAYLVKPNDLDHIVSTVEGLINFSTLPLLHNVEIQNYSNSYLN